MKNGDRAIVILQNPREKILGVIREINSAGISIRGIDLNYFDDWIKAINEGEQTLPMQEAFFPMWRVERVALDEDSEQLPSMVKQFEERTGRSFEEF